MLIVIIGLVFPYDNGIKIGFYKPINPTSMFVSEHGTSLEHPDTTNAKSKTVRIFFIGQI